MNRTAPQKFEEIRKLSIDVVDAHRRKGDLDGLKSTMSNVYPDEAHFIFELLQNAEDVEASKVHFQLNSDKLIVEHDGQRPFNEEDINAITSIGKSPKREDINKIGKFGVGFKAVFVYTHTPHIFSGEYSFSIRDLYIPDWIPDQSANKGETRFEFPFNNSQKLSKQCFAEIAKWLNEMPDTVLLFLRSITTITWEIEGQGGGHVQRDNHKDNKVIELIRQKTGDKLRYAAWWLRFEKPSTNEPSLFVSIAYRLEQLSQKYQIFDEKKSIAEQFKVTSTEGKLFIFFPADSETTKLKFHIHAPFAATVARDRIPPNSDNRDLFEDIVNLMASSLSEIRELGLLGQEFLSILPLGEDALSDFYQPMNKKIREVMRHQPLVPVLGGGHAPASDLFIGRQEIYSTIKNEFLPFFIGDRKSLWAVDCDARSRSGRFLREIGVKEWTYDDLLISVKNKFSSSLPSLNESHRWLEKKDDQWMQSFYALLYRAVKSESDRTWQHRYSWESSLNTSKYSPDLWAVIRTSDGRHLKGSEVYLSEKVLPSDLGLPRLKPELISGEKGLTKTVTEFLTSIAGVREFNDKCYTQEILKKYYPKERQPEISWEVHLAHLKIFVAYWKTKESLDFFHDHPVSLDDSGKYQNTGRLYIDNPLQETGLSYLFEKGGVLAGQRFPLAAKYDDVENSPSLIKFFSELGAMDHIKISKSDGNYVIWSLDRMLAKPDRKISLLIWKGLSQTGFQDGFTENSTFVKKLREAEWVLGKDGDFYTPLIPLDELSDEFNYNEKNTGVMKLLKLIGFETKNQRDAQSKAQQKNWEDGQRKKQEREEEKKRQERIKKAQEAGIVPKMTDYASDEQEEMIKLWEEKKAKANLQDNPKIKTPSSANDDQETLPSIGSEKALTQADVRNGFQAAFNKPGAVNINREFEEPSSLHNPDRYGEKTNQRYQEGRRSEPTRIERKRIVSREVWESKNFDNRVFFDEQYGGKCQICDYTFPQRSGKPYFEVVYLISHTQARWTDAPGSVLCLCAQCSAKFQYGAVTCDNVEDKLLALETSTEQGTKPQLKIQLIGNEKTITFSERHLIEIQELLGLEGEDLDET